MGTCYIASTGELFDSTDEPYFQSAGISPSSSLYTSDDSASIRKVTHLINTGEWELCHMPSVIHFHCHQESSLALANRTLFTLARPHIESLVFAFVSVLCCRILPLLAIEHGFDTDLGGDSGYQ